MQGIPILEPFDTGQIFILREPNRLISRLLKYIVS
jgi:hypothetical protein